MLIPDLDAGCSLAASIDAEQLAAWQRAVPGRGGRDVREHDRRGQGADRLLLHVGQRGRRRAPHLRHARRRTPRSCSARTCGSAPTSRRSSAGAMHVWDGECHVHAGHPPGRHRGHARRPPGRRLPDPPRVRLLDERDGVRRRRRHLRRGRAHALDRRDARVRRGASASRASRRAAQAPGGGPSRGATAAAVARQGRARRSWRPRSGCSTRCRWRRPTSSSSPPTPRRRACT